MSITYKYCNEKELAQKAKEFSMLCKESFAEHREKGINMGPCYMNEEKWKEWITGCIAEYIEDNGSIIAFWLVRIDKEQMVANGRIIAISPEYKGKHIGTRLTNHLIKTLRDMGINIFTTDTSIKLPHVIDFHMSYGCKAIGMTSWSNTNYYSILLRLAINPNFEITDEEANRLYKHSKIRCKLLLKEDGKSTFIGILSQYYFSILSRFKISN